MGQIGELFGGNGASDGASMEFGTWSEYIRKIFGHRAIADLNFEKKYICR